MPDGEIIPALPFIVKNYAEARRYLCDVIPGLFNHVFFRDFTTGIVLASDDDITVVVWSKPSMSVRSNPPVEPGSILYHSTYVLAQQQQKIDMSQIT